MPLSSSEKELNRSRQLLAELEEDALRMRKRVIELEGTLKVKDGKRPSNSSLDRFTDSDSGMKMRHGDDLESHYGMLKDQLGLQADELKAYRDKVLRLQDQLIRKNEIEKKMLRKSPGIQEAPASCDLEKQLDVKRVKVKSLEEAYRKQEKVIEKMEILLKMQNVSKHNRADDRLAKLEEENALLRKWLIDHKDGFPTQSMSLQDEAASRSKHHVDNLQDYLELKERFHKAETKIKQLEKQLSESIEAWDEEKKILMTQLKKQKSNASHDE